jgi:lysophospholipase L1-like esterase
MSLRIAFIGDSFVAGTGDPQHRGWVGRVCAAATARGHDVTGYNLGVRRDTSADVRSRWRDEAAARLPDAYARLLVFSFGVNDAVVEDGRRRVPIDATTANTRAILTEARHFAPCLFVGPPPTAEDELNASIAQLDTGLASLCGALEVSYLTVFAALRDGSRWVEEAASGDGVHPGAIGYAALGDLIEHWLPWRQRMP